MGRLKARLDKLDGSNKLKFMAVFGKPNETSEEVVARHFGEAGPPDDVELVVFTTKYEERSDANKRVARPLSVNLPSN